MQVLRVCRSLASLIGIREAFWFELKLDFDGVHKMIVFFGIAIV